MFLKRLVNEDRRPPIGGWDGRNIDINDDPPPPPLDPRADDQLVGKVIHDDDGDEADESNEETRALAAAADCCVDGEEAATADDAGDCWLAADCANACNNAWYGIKFAELEPPVAGDDDLPTEDGLITGNDDKNDDRSLV